MCGNCDKSNVIMKKAVRFVCALAIARLSCSAVSNQVPGVVIDHISAETKRYIGSPSIAVLANGNYVASHDVFSKGNKGNMTFVFSSQDKGATWKPLGEITNQWWSTLFVHGTNVYIMGTTKAYGAAVIRRSNDGGKSWTEPVDKSCGLLLAEGKYHCAPGPVVIHNGRLWRAMEDAMGPGGWGSHFRAFMMSAPLDADLLKAESWTCSNRLGRDTNWLGGKFGGWLEGNAVVTPTGEIVDMLRVSVPNYPEYAAVIHISNDGTKATFDPKHDFIQFPGGAKKFTIRFDAETKRYWSLVNYMPEKFRSELPDHTRNTLALVSSPDLKKWNVHQIILQHPDTKTHGFQYVDWLFEGDDIIAVARTAFDDDSGGAHNYHDANYLTFHRVKNFRSAK
jgi:photosystem II stability/assembly factor-like uncharacterized protein